MILVLHQGHGDLGARSSDVQTALSGCDAGASPGPYRAYTIDVVGQALASACGRSHRTIGADLGIPADTVRDWIRRVRARAQWLRLEGTIAAQTLDPMLPVIVPAGSALGDAMSALATAAASVRDHRPERRPGR